MPIYKTTKGVVMSSDFNSKLFGLGQSILNNDYQKHLDKKVEDILGDKESIGIEALKKKSIFKKVFETFDNNKLQAIFNLDGDAKNVSEKELKILLTALDANLENVEGKERFVLDGKEGYSKNVGVNQVTNDELETIYKYTQTRAEKKAEIMRKEKEEQERTLQNQKENDYVKKTLAKIEKYKLYNSDGKVNGASVAKFFKEALENIKCDNQESDERFEDFLEKAFQGKPRLISRMRDGGSELIEFDNTRVFVNLVPGSAEYGNVTVTTYKPRSEEEYMPDGKLIKK